MVSSDLAGSSPRWRGARTDQNLDFVAQRIIPALAGSTSIMLSSSASAPDHPRVGGEHTSASNPSAAPPGSSPRWRGALRRPDFHGRIRRIIPALAGSTQRNSHKEDDPADHPRVGGEHVPIRTSTLWRNGSSPRWRGALDVRKLLAVAARIIPALAGSTRRSRSNRSHATDHPRVGGEHVSASGYKARMTGSSPRWRGARGACAARASRPWIIPALAGSTHSSARPTATASDHPRVGGEHYARSVALSAKSGSSPRWRGAHFLIRLSLPESS